MSVNIDSAEEPIERPVYLITKNNIDIGSIHTSICLISGRNCYCHVESIIKLRSLAF